MLDEHKPVEDAAAAEDVALVVAARRHDMVIAKISPLLPLLPPPRRVFYAVVSTIYIQFFCGDKIMDTKIGGGFLLEGIFHTWKNFAQTRTIAAKSFKKQELVLLLLYFRVGGIGVIICLFIDQLCFRFQLFDFQSHASPNLRILRISAPPQQLFVFIQAFLRRLFRELRVLVEIRRPFALQRGFYFVSRVGEERVDVSLERRPLLRGDDAKKRETRRFRRWWCSSKTRRRRRRRRRPTASREEEEDARAQHGAVLVLRWSGEDTRAPPLFFSVKRDEKKGVKKVNTFYGTPSATGKDMTRTKQNRAPEEKEDEEEEEETTEKASRTTRTISRRIRAVFRFSRPFFSDFGEP